VSVGHVARGFEEAGIPTVSVFVRAFRHVTEVMKLPRAVITQHPMGRPLGGPGDRERQRTVIEAALGLFDSATAGGTVVEIGDAWRPGAVNR
jgi:hypothetical protein